MLDLRFIRENTDAVKLAAQQKGYAVDVDQLVQLDDERREILQRVEELRRERNEIALSAKQSKRPTDEQIARGKELKNTLLEQEERLKELQDQVVALQKAIPNMPADDVPVGASEDENVVVKEVGEKPVFDFAPKNHFEIAEAKGWIDKERAAKVAGARFAYLKGDLVKLQFAIINFVIHTLTSESVLQNIATRAGLDVSTKPFEPVLPPLMIKTDLYDAMDRLEPRDDRYKIEDEDLWLQGSAEHVLGAMHSGEVFASDDLPRRYLGYATSFRREAGTYGKDMEGIIRMHQFDKLEIESFSDAASGMNEHLLFVAIQEFLLEQLALPYRVVQKCSADIGKPNARGIDMDVWLPGQGKYRETHTADYMTDYQSRRLQTRVKTKTGELELVHTNDATAFALGRIMVAIIENYQTAEGNVRIPEALKPFIQSKNEI
ncbi:serine--tRNA ligase [Candidatus Saccharibacteria bacterium]|nr:MAG: serine--tRNA ligase [Candidatus Saccharibacteria bacterium]